VIRFAAFLVAVAVGLLVAGVVTSKLDLVYIAIGVSAVALLSLAIGAAVKRRELFGTPETTASNAAAPTIVTARVAVPTQSGQPVPATSAHQRPAEPETARSAQPNPAQPETAQPETAQPGTAQPETVASAHLKPAQTETATPGQLEPRGSTRPVAVPAGPTWPPPARPGSVWESAVPPTGIYPAVRPAAPGPGSSATRPADSRPKLDRADVPQVPAAFTRPSGASSSDTAGPPPPGTWDWPEDSVQARPAPAQVSPPPVASDAPDVEDLATAIDLPAVIDRRAATTPPPAQSLTRPDLRVRPAATPQPPAPSPPETPAPASASASSSSAASSAASSASGAPVAVEPEAAPASVEPEPEPKPARAAAAPAPVEPEPEPASSAAPSAPVESVAEPVSADAVIPESDEPETITADAIADPASDADASPASDAEASPSSPAAESAVALPADSGPDPQTVVTVVPGVPRYHNATCILIRFMGESDLDKMTIATARDAGCTPCRACLPD
jgi:hypothetical protein